MSDQAPGGRSVIEFDPRYPVTVLPPEDEQPDPSTEVAA
jgi:hypothetical protein